MIYSGVLFAVTGITIQVYRNAYTYLNLQLSIYTTCTIISTSSMVYSILHSGIVIST